MAKNETPKEKKPRWYKAIGQAFTYTVRRDSRALWYMIGVFIAIMAVGVTVGYFINQTIYISIVSFPFALIGAMALLTSRFTKAQYVELDGQMGSTQAVLGTIRRGWTVEENPVAFDPKTKDLVFRGVGRPGIILVGEANSAKIKRLLADERKRLSRILKDVPVTIIEVGNREDQVPLTKLVRTVQKLKPALSRAELGEVERRLSALGAAKLPIPKGIDPNKARMDRKKMR